MTEQHECVHEDDVKTIKDDVKEILKILNGNGETGMCAKVNLLWTGSIFLIGAVIIVGLQAFLG